MPELRSAPAEHEALLNGSFSRWSLMGHFGEANGTSLFTLPLDQVGGDKGAIELFNENLS